MRNTLVVTVLLLASPVYPDSFRPEALRAHMRFLADDLLEGRGYKLAAEYVAAQFEAAGLEPGAGGSYFQTVPFLKTIASPDSTVILTPVSGAPVTLKYGEAFVTYGDPRREDTNVASKVVLVGYGITAPELKVDDYAGVDVKGKIVALFAGAPSHFSSSLRAHYSSTQGKVENAAGHGAAGLLILVTREEAARAPWPRVIRGSKLGSMHWLESDGALHSVPKDLSFNLSLGLSGTEAFLAAAGKTLPEITTQLAAPRFKAIELPLNAAISIHSSHEKVSSDNVLGVLRGSDPALRDQYLVYTSHLDHIGMTDAVDGDAINNGALDNASGIAATIEIAKAFAALPKAPRRSIIFLATTGEEKGLKGADYFANNPTVPIDNIVANINIDEILMIAPVKDIVVWGIETSDLGDTSRKIAKDMGLEISPDPYPEEVIFVRSDQYPFVKRGVPAIFAGVGTKSVDPSVDVEKLQRQWFVTRYHAAKDDLDQPIHYPTGATFTEFNYRIGLDVANRTAPPAWVPGNFFGEKFARKKAPGPREPLHK